MKLRLEIFVNHLPTSIDFYGRVLGFTLGDYQDNGYTTMTKGDVHLGLNLRANLPDDHPVYATAAERLGRGIEIVFEVDDITAVYEEIRAKEWPIEGELQQQPWGLTDFRLIDPDGYYLRITSHG